MRGRPFTKALLPIAAAAFAGAAGFLAQPLTSGHGVVRTAIAAPADELFKPIATVLRDPRCMNCHPVGDRPRQGDDRHFHLQNVSRGEDDLGFVNLRCTACHRSENNAYSGVPGAPNWHLAPLAMGWEGLDDAQLCAVLTDKSKNGGRDIAALVEHMASDKLVMWGWNPGGNRKPVATPHDVFVKQLHAWQAANAPCPKSATP
ncbi:hypothetical protein [Hyphomicrobium sp.]|uniref:hypothetical protein n=1 Tax=Hyphomicrobium sp. TaxID=82 RepID=UPI002D768BFA|nr:hypothetical protein [Hyphomicrobium sp.]HET6388237.1 hypothetical protein [Hyphomicrobium sp.]